MIATRRVYPIGYSALGAQERIDALLDQPMTLLIDTRISPKSWNAAWRKEELQAKYGDKYKWAGKFLGNKGLNTGRIEIANPVLGIKGLMRYLSEDYDLVILCQCREFLNCHRSEIVRLLTEQVHVDVIHWQPAEQEAVLAVETDELPAETVERPDDDPSAAQGHCAVCHNLATLKSPSGRPEGMYCERHGYCSRCKGSIEQFMQHPYNDVYYVCPCVVAFLMRIEEKQELKQAKPVAMLGF